MGIFSIFKKKKEEEFFDDYPKEYPTEGDYPNQYEADHNQQLEKDYTDHELILSKTETIIAKIDVLIEKISKLEEDGINDYTYWRSFKTASNSQSNSNLAETTDSSGNIYYLSGSRYGAYEEHTVYLTKLNRNLIITFRLISYRKA